MDRRGRDTQRCLWNHTCLLRPLNTGNDITGVIQSTEDTGDIHALCLLDLIHQLTDIVRNGIHTDGIETTVEHVCLDTHLIEGFTKSTDSRVGILTGKQVHLLKSTSIGFHTGKTPHINNHRGNAFQLIFTRLEFTT